MSQAKKAGFSSLSDKYLLREGNVPLSGIQGIVRALIDSSREDQRLGNDISLFVSGYQGSPLGGLDTEILRASESTSANRIVFRPGLNEELAATAVMGTQLMDSLGGKTVKGATGVWYGKSPGVDRATDAMRHGNLIGSSPNGGAVVLAGDDPAAKSSTVPGSSEATLAALGMPVLFAGNTQELIGLFRHAVVMSRVSGLWSGLKVVTKVADSTGVIAVGSELDPILPALEWGNKLFRHRPDAHLLGPRLIEMEETLSGIRLAVAREYIYLNHLNSISHAPQATFGIVATGTTYFDLLSSLRDLGVEDSPAIRVMKMTALHPIDPRPIFEFADGLSEILVLEEKGPFVERTLKEILYRAPNAPRITGKSDTDGMPLVLTYGALEADDVSKALGRRLLAHFDFPGVTKRLEELSGIDNRRITLVEQRTPFFCSGCPHNTSTHAPDGTIVGAGIGCHTLILLNPAGRGDLTGVTQMGGEGAQFIGIAPFMGDRHFSQNMGDGTFHHSGSLAIRAAVAAGINVTYKILYNDAVAMTGGQKVEGQLTIPEMIEMLYLEGVARVVVTTDDPSKYRALDLPHQTRVFARETLDEVQADLAKIEGTTVIIHDQLCAIEKRRRRRVGKLATPKDIVVINERTCEGCGDCGEKSNCLSVEPVTTEFGRKTRINQGSCSQDRSCLKGDCPSFLLVEKPSAAAKKSIAIPEVDIPEPVLANGEIDTRIRLVGIGGTGVVTLSAILEVATVLDGKFAIGLDQTGLSQKAGPVVSDIRITSERVQGSATFSAATADLLLGFDLIGTAAVKNLRVASPERTRAVISTSIVPTGREVTDVSYVGTSATAAVDLISRYTRAEENFYIRAQELATALYDDEIPANVIVLGAAWQLGLIPLSLAALVEGFKLNKVAVATNLESFRWGRLCVTHPELIARIIEGRPAQTKTELPSELLEPVARLGLTEQRASIELRAMDLVAYQNLKLAKDYLSRVGQVSDLLLARGFDKVDAGEIVAGFAKGLHKLIAYKDEYEVARLHLEWLRSAPPGTKATMLLHPPILRAMGMKNKIRLAKSAKVSMKVLYSMRGLRTSALNPFGQSPLRKTERLLAGEFEEAVHSAISKADPSTLHIVSEICALPDLIRGYEQIKEANLEKYHDQLGQLMLKPPSGASV